MGDGGSGMFAATVTKSAGACVVVAGDDNGGMFVRLGDLGIATGELLALTVSLFAKSASIRGGRSMSRRSVRPSSGIAGVVVVVVEEIFCA